MIKVRLDRLLVERGLCGSRAEAQARVLAGDVLVGDRPVTKAGTPVPGTSELRLRGGPARYVGRGGQKLEGALKVFDIDPSGMVCFDAGASTGGFTDCLLQHGASRVYAVDVGTNQLHWKLRSDSRVVSMEQNNLRDWRADNIPDKCTLLVADLSFISLKLAIPPILPSLLPEAQALLLIKPQFEAGRDLVGRGGIVKDPAVHQAVCGNMWAFFSATQLKPRALAPSPILGASGNREFFLHLHMSAGLVRDAGEILDAVQCLPGMLWVE